MFYDDYLHQESVFYNASFIPVNKYICYICVRYIPLSSIALATVSNGFKKKYTQAFTFHSLLKCYKIAANLLK